jgi:hypothetical protein
MSNELPGLFAGVQATLAASLHAASGAIGHPVAKGDAAELAWLRTLNDHLPLRYQATRGFVIDSSGTRSQQLDLILYDRQYTPLLYNQEQQRVVPAESVYAVFEVKPTLTTDYLRYAAEKIGSVRRLVRTTVAVPAGGVFEPRVPFRIVGGLLVRDSSLSPPFGETFSKTICSLEPEGQIDFVCALKDGSAHIAYEGSGAPAVTVAGANFSLAFLVFKLLGVLQTLGTVPALDYSAYIKSAGIVP